MKKRTWRILPLAALLLALGCAKTPAPVEATAALTEAPTIVEAADTGADAPAESGAYAGIAFTASDMDGNEITEDYIRDHRVTVVNFWATWCPPCVGEIPEFSKVAAAYADKGCAVLGVQLDEDASAAKKLWEKNGVVYPSVLPDGDLAEIAGGLSAIPVTMLFDSAGKPIGDMHVGSMSEGDLTALLDAALETR